MGKKRKYPISDELRRAVFKRDGYRCRYCGSTTGPFHADHVYPESKGGETTIDNLVTACARCNISKGSKVGYWPTPIAPLADIAERSQAIRIGKRTMALLYICLLLLAVVTIAEPSMRMFWPITGGSLAVGSWFMWRIQ